MNEVIFREYDIRGVVGRDFIIESTYNLARALAVYFVEKNPALTTVAVGMDGRVHSPAIKELLCKGFLDSGLSVVFLGVCPSPALYFALHTLPVHAGVMITASHNSKEYNGLKICLGTDSVSGAEIASIKKLFKSEAVRPASEKGSYQEISIIEPYITQLVERFGHLRGMTLPAVIDCGNGVAGTVFPKLIKAFGWKGVQLLYADVDGTYPNHEADPTVEKNMVELKQILASTLCQVGIGLDGDADRMAAMTKAGELVLGDRLLALFAQQLATRVSDATVVFDVNASMGLIEVLKEIGLRGHMAPVGFPRVKEQAKRQQALLAGELSCHFLFKDRYFGYDDGIYSALRLFDLLLETGKTLAELVDALPHFVSTPAIRMLCAEEDKQRIIDAVHVHLAKIPGLELVTIDGVRAQFSQGWGIIRASNTEPKIMVRFEAQNPEGINIIKHEFYSALEPFFDGPLLKELLGI